MINSRDNFYVYIHYRLDNMQPFYIGKGTGDRAHRKNNRSKWWLNIVNKFGYEVKIVSDNLSEEDAFELEIFLIDELGRKDLNKGPLINLTNGGDGVSGYKFTEEQRKALSDSHKGIKSHLYCKKGANHYLYGKKQSQEHIDKRVASLTGKRRSDSAKQQQSIRMSGTKLSQNTKDKIAKIRCEKVICFTDNGFHREFDSLSEGAIYFNIHITNISNCCLGIRQSAGKHPETNEKLRWRKFDAE